jgi:hypothetical protein
VRQLLGYLRLLLATSKKNLMVSQKSVWLTRLLHMQKAGQHMVVAIKI